MKSKIYLIFIFFVLIFFKEKCVLSTDVKSCDTYDTELCGPEYSNCNVYENGSFVCSCDIGDNYECQHCPDLCGPGTSGCSKSSFNTHTCFCKDWTTHNGTNYYSNGTYCEDCSKLCGIDSECYINIHNDYTCYCGGGYRTKVINQPCIHCSELCGPDADYCFASGDDKICHCKQGYHNNGTYCTPCSDMCGPGYREEGSCDNYHIPSYCDCKFGYFYNGSYCIECPESCSINGDGSCWMNLNMEVECIGCNFGYYSVKLKCSYYFEILNFAGELVGKTFKDLAKYLFNNI